METLQKVMHPKSLFEGERLVVVTGADKGIGYAVVKGILKENPNWTVCLTSRDESRGKAAVQRLHDEIKLTAKYHQLDIDDESSISRFRDHISENHKNGIHILINNAGVFPKFCDIPEVKSSSQIESTGQMQSTPESVGGVPTEVGQPGSEKTEGPQEMVEGGKEEKKSSSCTFDKENYKLIIQNNYFSTLHVCEALFPLLGENSTVVFVGSRMGNLAYMNTLESKQLKLRGCTRIEDVSKLMEQLMNTDPDCLYNPENKEDENAWLARSPEDELIPNYHLGEIYPWAMSKLGLSIICRLYQLQFDAEKQPQNIHVVTCCPGLVKTDLNPKGTRTPEQGADTIIWAATQPKDTPIRGVVCGDRKMLDPFVLPEGSTIF
jgi:NAD(P)-dependent dehydrogenase (short-subunit alcohol dehydrogenase family)